MSAQHVRTETPDPDWTNSRATWAHCTTCMQTWPCNQVRELRALHKAIVGCVLPDDHAERGEPCAIPFTSTGEYE